MQVPARVVDCAFQTVSLILLMTEVAMEHSTSQLQWIKEDGVREGAAACQHVSGRSSLLWLASGRPDFWIATGRLGEVYPSTPIESRVERSYGKQ